MYADAMINSNGLGQMEVSPVNCFKWSGSSQIGHPEIDEQHKRLFLLGETVVVSLANPGEEKLAAAHLQAFIDYAQEHFKYEEYLMQANYPAAERHAKYHASLLLELMAHRKKMQWGQNPDPEGLTSFLWSWLTLHIDIVDRELVAWLKTNERKS